MSQVRSLQTGIKFKDTPIGKIPVDWEVRQIEHVCDVVGGSTPSTANKEYWHGDILWATPTDITKLKGRIIEDTKQKISEKGLQASAANLLPEGSILMTSRATIGACAINTKPMATNQGFASLICKERAYNWFVYYMILFFRKELERLGSGSTFKEISKKSIKSFYIPIPPPPEQKKIAEILTTVDDAIEETVRIIEKTRELKKGLMQKLLTRGIGHKKFKKTDIGEIPVEWEVRRIKDFVEDFSGGAALTPSDFTDDGIKILPKLGVIPGGILAVPDDRQKYCSHEYAKDNKASLVNRDYIITVLRDLVPAGPSIGLMVKIPNSDNYILAQGVYGIKIKQDKLLEDYLIQLSNSSWYREYMQKIMVGSTQVHIRNNEFLNLLIPYPHLSEQKEIADILAAIDSEIDNEDANKQNLETLKKSLMQVLLTGKVRVKLH